MSGQLGNLASAVHLIMPRRTEKRHAVRRVVMMIPDDIIMMVEAMAHVTMVMDHAIMAIAMMTICVVITLVVMMDTVIEMGMEVVTIRVATIVVTTVITIFLAVTLIVVTMIERVCIQI